MSSDDDMEARHGRMLAELAAVGMGMVRRLNGALQAAADDQALALLAEAFHTVSRSVRQTLALEFKLRHEPRAPAAPTPEPKPAVSPPPVRPDRPERVYWNEYERPDWDERLDAALTTADRDAINQAVETSIARIQRGLASAERVLAGPGADTKPAARAKTRAALLSTSSPVGPRLRVPLSADDNRVGEARPPPWRNSG